MKRVTAMALAIACAAIFASCAKKQVKDVPQKADVTLENAVQKKGSYIEVRFVQQGESEGNTWAVRETNEFLVLEDTVLFTQNDIASAVIVFDDYGNSAVKVILTDAATARFASITESNIGRRLGIVVNSELITAPQIRQKITDGSLLVKGSLTKGEAEKIKAGIGK